MSVSRSPRYPAISLQDAIDKAAAIFKEEHRNPMSPEVAVRHIGYKSVNGNSLRAIASLKTYGLLEGKGESLTITDDAICIIADKDLEDQSERIKALNRSLIKSELFSELATRFEKAPSKANLTAHLTKSGFKPDAADWAAGSYLDSLAFVEKETKTYNEKHGTSNEALVSQSSEGGVKVITPQPITMKLTAGQANLSVVSVSGMRQDIFTLEEGQVVLQWPSQLSKESFEDFESWLQLILRKTKRSLAIEKQPHGKEDEEAHPLI